jgi:hypothetical protein
MLKSDIRIIPSWQWNEAMFLLFDGRSCILFSCSSLVPRLHVGMRIVFGCYLSCAMDDQEPGHASLLGVWRCHEGAKQSAYTTPALPSSASSSKKTMFEELVRGLPLLSQVLVLCDRGHSLHHSDRRCRQLHGARSSNELNTSYTTRKYTIRSK